eukprot:COSAG06_NODE_22493_length_721_cov_2.757235_1_plen_80_part_10
MDTMEQRKIAVSRSIRTFHSLCTCHVRVSGGARGRAYVVTSHSRSPHEATSNGETLWGRSLELPGPAVLKLGKGPLSRRR